jgi:hypothetical protein
MNPVIRVIKTRALEGMQNQIDTCRAEGRDAGYTEDDVRKLEKILDDYLAAIDAAEENNEVEVMAVVKDAVLALNKLYAACEGQLIEKDQREDLATVINLAAAARGVGDGTSDITEQWRDW